MEINLMPGALQYWDDLIGKSKSVDSLVLSFWDDERPLHGAAGLVDWRLCGRLSRLITSGHCSGEKGDSIMMPAGPRLPFSKLFLFGLGNGKRMDEDSYLAHVKRIRGILKRAGVTEYALQAPGRSTGLISARRAVELWRSSGAGDDEVVTFIDTPAAQKEMGEALI